MQSIEETTKDNIFGIIQNFLKLPPVIIWGSGATIPYGLPSMAVLNDIIKNKVADYDNTAVNLEEELGKEKYESCMPEIRQIIWNTIKEADEKIIIHLLHNSSHFNGIYSMIKKCIAAEPQVANIITTNYDRILEYVMAYHGIQFTDGFNGRHLSAFNDTLFQGKNIVNLVKVHGSINWGCHNDDIRYVDCIEEYTPVIIPPGKNKYREAYKEPYRELIHKADQIISNANSIFVVGFGFNDEHLTPKVKEKAAKGTPIVLITLKISDTTYKELQSAQKYVLIESTKDNKSKVYIKKDNQIHEYIIDGEYWQLNKFMEEVI